MRMYVGVTDKDWYNLLRTEKCEEVNFWKPGGNTTFKAINPGELFLFKLHSPENYVVGGGIFIRYSILPERLEEMPAKEYLEWHNNNIFIGA